MRRFLVVGHRADSTGHFKLDDLPGSGGRMDILAMSTSAALFLSHGLRQDTEVWLVLNGGRDGRPRTIRMIGSEARYLFPDERNMASMIRNSLIRYHGKGEMESTPGMYISDMGLNDALRLASQDSELIYLKEEGEDVRETEIPENTTFVLGDSEDLSSAEESVLMSIGAKKIRLGKTHMHTWQAIAVMNYELDRRSGEEDGTL